MSFQWDFVLVRNPTVTNHYCMLIYGDEIIGKGLKFPEFAKMIFTKIHEITFA